MLNLKALGKEFLRRTHGCRHNLADRIEGVRTIEISPEDIANIFFQRDMSDRDQKRLSQAHRALEEQHKPKAEIADLLRFHYPGTYAERKDVRDMFMGETLIPNIPQTAANKGTSELQTLGMPGQYAVVMMMQYMSITVTTPNPTDDERNAMYNEFVQALYELKENAPQHFQLRVSIASLKAEYDL